MRYKIEDRKYHFTSFFDTDTGFYLRTGILDEDGKWHIIEINPRLSGMTTTYAAAAGINLYEYIYRAATGQSLPKLRHVINKKIPLQSQEELQELGKQENILFISQIKNLAALQERERGYCEIVLSRGP